jgi:hypothetical protein
MRCHGVIGEFLDASYRIVEVERSASASGETGQLCGTAPTISQALVAAIDLRHERVDDEWSFVETMRHLVYATDAWASRTILDQPLPYQSPDCPATDGVSTGRRGSARDGPRGVPVVCGGDGGTR